MAIYNSTVLFLSADLINSTQYKHQVNTKDNFDFDNFSIFRDFYNDFPVEAETNITARLKYDKIANPSQLKLWKILGDEILFEYELKSLEELPSVLDGFMKTVIEYHNNLKSSRSKIGLKGSAWIATFPIPNVKISTNTGSNNDYDYLGPSIDVGFRLSKYSTENKFVISLELAYLLCSTKSNLKEHVMFSSYRILKGVDNNEEYPILWIFTGNEDFLDSIEYSSNQPLHPDIIIKEANRILSKQGNAFILPFIYSDGETKSGVEPSNYVGLLENYEQWNESKDMVYYQPPEVDASNSGEETRFIDMIDGTE